MLSNRVAFAALAVACIGAAGVGGYLASRQSDTSTAALSAAAPASLATPVQETEAVIDEGGQKAAATTPPTASGTETLKRSEATARTTTPTTARAAKPAASAQKSPDPLPTLDRTWPSSATAGTSSAPQTAPNAGSSSSSFDQAPQVVRSDDRAVPEAPRAPEPPQKVFEELVVPGESVIGLQADSPVTSERARIEDRVEARVTRDVRVHDMVAIPAGTRAVGSVTQVDRGGKFKERARLGIRFHTLVLADGTRLPIQTETIYRYGEAPGNESASKIGGGAAIGAIIGAIIGGGKGAAIGASTGAGAGTAAVMNGERNAATVHPGEPITVRITSPVTVTVEQK